MTGAQILGIVLFIAAIVAGVVVMKVSEAKRWNNGTCADCGTIWLYDGGWCDDYNYKCLCGKHKMSSGSHRDPKHWPNKDRMLRHLDDLYLSTLYRRDKPRPLSLYRAVREVLVELPEDSAEHVELGVHGDGEEVPDTFTLTVRGQPHLTPKFTEARLTFETADAHVRCAYRGVDGLETLEWCQPYTDSVRRLFVTSITNTAADWGSSSVNT